MGLVCLIRALFLSHAFGYSFNGQLAMGVSRGNWGHIPNISKAQKYHNSKCNNGLKVILISSFADVKERREEREESLALVLAPSLARKHGHFWAQTKVYVRKSKKKKIRHGTT